MEGPIMPSDAVTDIDKDAGPNDGGRTTSTIMPDCSPQRFLDWRLRYAYHLAEDANQLPIEHEDPWAQEAAQLIYAGFLGDRKYKPTLRQWHIRQALSLHNSGSLVETVLQARLLSQQTHGDIAAKCRIDLLTIEAYATLLFDVRGHDGVRRWFQQQFSTPPRPKLMIWQIGMVPTSCGAFEGPVALEQYVAVLCRLDGPTMADGLPDRSSPRFLKELQLRQALADPLLPRSRPTAQLMERFEQATRRDVRVGGPSDEAIELGIEILRKARIPAALRKEIARFRENCTPRQQPSTVVEAIGAPDGQNQPEDPSFTTCP
jgi:hypothetical protein